MNIIKKSSSSKAASRQYKLVLVRTQKHAHLFFANYKKSDPLDPRNMKLIRCGLSVAAVHDFVPCLKTSIMAGIYKLEI